MKPIRNLELEQKVLESLMIAGKRDNLAVQKAFLELNSSCFYDDLNAELFLTIKKLFDKQEPFGFIDVLSQIPTESTELHDCFTWILDNYHTFGGVTNNLERETEKLVSYATVRLQVAKLHEMLITVASNSDISESQSLITKTLNETADLTHQKTHSGITVEQLAEKYYNNEMHKQIIIPTMSERLNAVLGGGIRPKMLITIAAGAGIGKTGFAIKLLDLIAGNQLDRQNLFFSLEMESIHIWQRLLGIIVNKPFDDLTADEILSATAISLDLPLTIYDASNARNCNDIDYIVTTARLKAMEKPISTIVVDYLGLVTSSGQFERNDLRQADITTKLANLAIELDCTVIALSQINRNAANRAKDDQCPYPSDAADSSGSHRSSGLWLGLDRPEVYSDDPNFRNKFIVKCRKNRFGDNFEIFFTFDRGTFGENIPSYFLNYEKPEKKSIEDKMFKSYYDRD